MSQIRVRVRTIFERRSVRVRVRVRVRYVFRVGVRVSTFFDLGIELGLTVVWGQG